MTDLHYKMVVVVVPCRTDIVIDDTDMVLLSTTNWWLWMVAPCRTDIVIDLNYDMVLVVAIPCKIDIEHGAWYQLQDRGPTKWKKELE